jgi:hypothetical protein
MLFSMEKGIRGTKAKPSLKISHKLYEKGIVYLVFSACEMDATEERAQRDREL